MTYSVCLHWGPLSFTPTTSVVSIDELRAKVQNITRVGTISRAAIPNARVMSVFPLLMTDYSELAKGIVFSLQSVESVDHENQTVKSETVTDIHNKFHISSYVFYEPGRYINIV